MILILPVNPSDCISLSRLSKIQLQLSLLKLQKEVTEYQNDRPYLSFRLSSSNWIKYPRRGDPFRNQSKDKLNNDFLPYIITEVIIVRH